MVQIVLVLLLVINASPAKADLFIDGEVSLTNETLTYEENITIASGGTLTFTNCTVTFSCGHALEYGITIEEGGTLHILDGDGLQETKEDSSRIMATYPFFMTARRGSELLARNSVVSGCGGEAGLELETSAFNFEGVTFRDSDTAIYLKGTTGGSISNTTFENLEYGIKGSLDHGLKIANCEFRRVSIAVKLHILQTGPSSSLVIEGNTFDTISEYNIWIKRATGVKIVSNVFENSVGKGIRLEARDSTPSNCSLTNNSFTGCAYPLELDEISGVDITDSDFNDYTLAIALNGYSRRISDVEIANNSFRRGHRTIFMFGSFDVTVRNNEFEDVNVGIDSAGHRIVISNNSFMNNWVGIKKNNDGTVVVTGNSFNNCTYGVMAQREGSQRPGLDLRNNSFRGNRVGALVSNVEPLVLDSNTWIGDETGLVILGSDVEESGSASFDRCGVGVKIQAVRGTIRGYSISECNIGFLVDLDSNVQLVECRFVACLLDVVASNFSTASVVDSLHQDRFQSMDDGSTIKLFNTSGVRLVLASSGMPAVNIQCELIPANSTSLGRFRTDNSGMVGPRLILQAEWKMGGPEWFIPYTVTVFFKDLAHPFTVPFSGDPVYQIVVDDVPPDASFLQPGDGALFNMSQVVFTVEVHDQHSGVETVSVLIDGEPWRDFQGPPMEIEFVAQMDDGAHAMEIEVTDVWRNRAFAWVEIEVDTIPPVISMDSPVDGLMTNRTSVIVNGTVTGADIVEINGVSVELDGVDRFSSEFILAMEGLNELIVRASDGFGNLAIASVSVVLDTIPPEITLEPTPALTNTSILVVSGQTDAVKVRVTPPGIDVRPSNNFSVEVHLEEGLNEVTIEAWDLVGNLAIKELSCILDTRIEFETVSPINGATVDNITVVVLCLTEEGLMLRIVDDTPGDWYTADEGGHIDLTLELPIYGQNIFVFELQDSAGNTATAPYSLNRAGIPVESEDGSSSIIAIAVVLFLLVTVSCIFLVKRRGEERTA